ncbi:MAG: hypothetical protein SPL13_01815 [Clostridia bacterium]|nr:hypothetical protein [Clostridia bacterium]
MTKENLKGNYVIRFKDGVSTVGKITDVLKSEKGNEYLSVLFNDGTTALFPFPDIADPKFSNAFKFVDDEVKEYVEKLYAEKENIPTNITKSATTSLTTSVVNKDIKRINDLTNGKFIGRNISQKYGNITMDKKLIINYQYGTTAQKIYLECCSVFGFYYSKQGSFAKQKPLFATNCTPDGYDVWMLAHSDVKGDTNKTWWNFIEYNGKRITQYNINPGFNGDNLRLTFVKQANGYYVYLGIYKYVNSYTVEDGNAKYYAYILERVDENDYVRT